MKREMGEIYNKDEVGGNVIEFSFSLSFFSNVKIEERFKIDPNWISRI